MDFTSPGRPVVASVRQPIAGAGPATVLGPSAGSPAIVSQPTPTLVARWRADSIGVANGAGVASWVPTVGVGTFAQATAGNQPTFVSSNANFGNKQTMHFTAASSQWLDTSTAIARSQPVTVSMVFQFADLAALYELFDCGILQILLLSSTQFDAFAGTDLTVGTPTTNPSILTFVANGTSSQVWLNGTQLGSTGNAGTSGVDAAIALGRQTSGASRYLNGDIAEVQVHNGPLTSAQIATLHSYAQDYYGIPVANYVASGTAATAAGTLSLSGTASASPVGAAGAGTLTLSGTATPTATVTTLFSDGFETGNTSAWAGQLVGTGGSLTVQSTTKQAGTYALTAVAGTGTTYLFHTDGTAIPASGVYSAQAQVYVTANPTTSGGTIFSTQGSYESVDVQWNGSAYNLRVLNQDLGVYGTSSGSFAISLNTWHLLEVTYDTTQGSRAVVTAYLDGTSSATYTDASTGAIDNTTKPYQVFLQATKGCTVIYDQVKSANGYRGTGGPPSTAVTAAGTLSLSGTAATSSVQPASGDGQLTLTGAASTPYQATAAATLSLSGAATIPSTIPPSMPVISRSVPAYETGTFYPASNANDADYSTTWRSVTAPTVSVPQRLSYDLSGVASASRTSAVLVWYNDVSGDYDNANPVASQPRDYTIDANTAAGGTLPATGWTALVTVTANIFHAREHALNLSTYNWVRLSVTATNGTNPNNDVNVQMDVHDAAAGDTDDWLFLGDSITTEGMQHYALGGGALTGGPLAQLINTQLSGRFPLILNGGHGGMNMDWLNTNKGPLLAPFTGHYVGISMGTNDANQGTALTQTQIDTWYTNLLSVIDYVISLGKVPVVSKIPWGSANSGMLGTNANTLNAKVTQAYTARPSTIAGPDFWTFFNAHQNLIRDGIHPTFDPAVTAGLYNSLTGYENWQRLWRDSLVANVYTNTLGGSGSAATAAGTLSLSGSSTGNLTFTATAAATLSLSGTASDTLRYSASASGTLNLSGTATAALLYPASASGTLSLSGTASSAVVTATTGAATLTLTGQATDALSFPATAAGALSLSGTTTDALSFPATAAGSLSLAGAATDALRYPATATAMLALAGTATDSLTYPATAAGTLSLSGTATDALAYPTAAAGTLSLAGTATDALRFPATPAATLTLSGTATSSSLTYAATAAGSLALSGLALTGNAVSSTAAGSLTVSGTATDALRYVDTAAGTLTLSGTATSSISYSSTAAAALTLSGTSTYLLTVSGTAAAALTLSGGAAGTYRTPTSGTGQLTLAGTSLAALQAAATAQALLSLSGTATGTLFISTVIFEPIHTTVLGAWLSNGQTIGAFGSDGSALAGFTSTGQTTVSYSLDGKTAASITSDGGTRGTLTTTGTTAGAFT